MAEGALLTQPLEVDDFSGGKTDRFISARPNQFEDADNMVLIRYGSKAKLVTRLGSQIHNTSAPRIPANDRLTCLASIDDTLFSMSGRNVYTIVSNSFTTIQGPTSNPALSAGTTASFQSWDRWQKHLILTSDALANPTKIFHDGVSWKARTLGLPTLATGGIGASLTAGGASLSYVYALHYSDSYTSNSKTYREVGPVSLMTVAGTGTAIDGSNPVSFTSLPSLSNSTTGNYNTSALKLEIYRTTNGGTTFYKVGEVTNGTTTFSDTTTDAALVSNAPLYTEGGIVDYDPAPQAKYVAIVRGTAFYCGVVESGVTYGQKIRQSIPGAPYAAPLDFWDEVEDDITGIGVINIYPIVFTSTKTYRIEGLYDEFGQGGFIVREISNTIGCVSNRSIVRTREGLFFASEQGFMFTDGFNIRPLSDEFPDSYQELMASDTTKARIYGTFDTIENRVVWSCQRDTNSNDNDIVFIAHLSWPNIPFTTWSGGSGNEDNFASSAVHFFDGKLFRGDRRGYLIEHASSVYTDPKIDTSAAVGDWTTRAIIYDYRGPAFDFGTTDVRKWVPKVVVNAENITNLSLAIYSNNDNSGVFNALAEITSGSNDVWGDSTTIWGDSSDRWNYQAVISHWRRFPTPIRCIYRQVKMTNSYTVIEDSTIISTANVDTTTNTVTLTGAGLTFAADAIDYYISFANDSYAKEFKITAVSTNTATVADPDNTLDNLTASAWRIKGYAKGQVFNLLSYVLDFALITQTQNAYGDNS